MAPSESLLGQQLDGIYPAQASRYLESLKLHLNSPEPAIICNTCKYALHPESVTRHVGKHGVPLWERAALTNVVRALRLPEPSALTPRPDHSPADARLIVRHGYSCGRCDYRTTSKDLFGRHGRQRHGKAPASDTADSTGVLLFQSWLENGASGYWIVRPSDAMSTLSTASMSRCARLEQLHNLEQKTLHAHRAEATTNIGGNDMTLVNNWMHRTGWNELFGESDRLFLARLSEMPSTRGDGSLHLGHYGGVEIRSPAADEAKISRILDATGAALERCRDTVRHTDISVRCWLRSQTPDRPYKAPFMLTGRRSSEKTYERLLCRGVCFCIRLWRLPAVITQRLGGRKVTEAQRKALERVWHGDVWSTCFSGVTTEAGPRASVAFANAGSHGSECSDREHDDAQSDYEASGDESDDEDEDEDDEYEDTIAVSNIVDFGKRTETKPVCHGGADRMTNTDRLSEAHSVLVEDANDDLVDLVLGLLHFLATEEYEDGRPSSTLLIYFSSVLGISSNGLNFERPSNYTPKLSGLIHCIRLILLESTLPRLPHPTLRWETRPRRGQLTILNATRVEKMCLGSQAPMGELLSLRSYGRALSRSEGPSFRVYWSGDGQTVSWADGSLNMSQFRNLCWTVLKHANSCCDQLMYQWKPPCDMSSLKDALSNTSYGYSFVTDPVNGLTDAYLELSRLACLAEVGGLMAENDWDSNAVRRYLELHREFQNLLMLLICLFGGQMPRGTDLLAVAHCNSAANRRGVCVYSGTIAIINQVNKARRATNKEFYVVRYLPADVAPLFYRYLVYIRRFCCMLHRTCLASDMDTPLLFPSTANPEQPRKTDELTKTLQEYTEKATGVSLGVRLYRQLTIAITEKHVQQTSRPFNRYDDTTADADVNVAFAWQSGHRPVQRGVNYGLDGAFPDSLQPALLKVYKWVSDEWHRFLYQDQSSLTSDAPIVDIDPAAELTSVPKTATSISGATAPTPRQHLDGITAKSHGLKTKRSSSPSLTGVLSRKRQKQTPVSFSDENSHSKSSHVPIFDVDGQVDTDIEVGSPWATPTEINVLRRAPSIPWPSCSALFGRVSHFEKEEFAQERRTILHAIHTREQEKNRYFETYERIRVAELLRKWASVGCQLCYAHTREPQPDHTIIECRLWGSSERAQVIRHWLDKLPIPRYNGGIGCCSLCVHTDAPCDEVRLSDELGGARTEEEKDHWKQVLASKHGPNGHCENRPVIMDVIAALCLFDDQVLGKVLVEKITKRDGVNFAAENQVSFWMSGRVPFKGCWVPRLIFVFELLLWAFEIRRELSDRALDEAVPTESEKDALSMGWGDPNEIQHWKRCLEWWNGKCAFCAGRGLRGSHIQHSLEACHRGGSRQLQRELGECIYMEGLRPQAGCVHCGIPREFCARWERAGRAWKLSGKQCQYGNLIFSTIIGLFYCDCKEYRMDAYATMDEDMEPDRRGRTDEDVAIWLGSKCTVVDIECSLFMRTLGVWTQMVWRRQSVL